MHYLALGCTKTYDRQYMITAGRADPSFIVTNREALSDAQNLYQRFDNREPGVVKPILDPRR